MAQFDNAVLWSMPCGRLRGIQIRLSPLFLFAFLPVWYHMGVVTCLIYAVTFFSAVLIHEFARFSLLDQFTIQRMGPLTIWPFGNLGAQAASVPPGKGFAECILGLMSLVMGAMIALTVVSTHSPPSWQDLFQSLPVLTGKNPLLEAAQLLLAVNVKLLVINLLPIRSTDTGRCMEYLLAGGWNEEDRREISLKFGLFTAVSAGMIAAMQDSWWLFAAISVLISLTVVELSRPALQRIDPQEDSFLGYDFSAGYTSLESLPAENLDSLPPQPVGFFGRWKARQADERRRKAAEELRQIDEELDVILSKVHEQGVQGLTSRERQLLNQASQEYRRRGKAGST